MIVTNLTAGVVTFGEGEFVLGSTPNFIDVPYDRYLALQNEFSALETSGQVSLDFAETLGVLPSGDNSSIDVGGIAWNKFEILLRASVKGGSTFSKGVVSTYPLSSPVGSLSWQGGVLAPNGDIHFVPSGAIEGQKISAAGVVSTYSLVYTPTFAYTLLTSKPK
jgi:hypothetical protein